MSLALANRQKAAALLVALGPERATSLLRTLDADAVSELTAEVAAIGPLAPHDASTLLRDVAQEIVGRRMAATGGPVYAKELLERVLGPERAGELSGRLGGPPARRPFAWLAAPQPAPAA